MHSPCSGGVHWLELGGLVATGVLSPFLMQLLRAAILFMSCFSHRTDHLFLFGALTLEVVLIYHMSLHLWCW